MTRIRELFAKYPAASAAIAVVVLAVAGWRIYQTTAGGPQGGRSTPPPAASPPPQQATVPQPATPPKPSAGGKPAGAASGSGAGASPSGEKPASTVAARDPFSSPIGSGTGGGQPLPPVPPLAPGASTAGPGGPGYRVAGIIRDAVALAIVEDGTRSYIVEPGDVLRPGVRVTAIDARRGVVRLMADGLPVELQLIGRGKAP